MFAKAAKRELERQRQLEWERSRRQELLTQRNREQENIVLLKARKKTLEFELEALVHYTSLHFNVLTDLNMQAWSYIRCHHIDKAVKKIMYANFKVVICDCCIISDTNQNCNLFEGLHVSLIDSLVLFFLALI